MYDDDRSPLTEAEERLLRHLLPTEEHFPEPALTWLRRLLLTLDTERVRHDRYIQHPYPAFAPDPTLEEARSQLRAELRAAVEELPATPFYSSGEDYMCPNCVTPWKCNGPHIPEEVEPAGYDVDRADVLALISGSEG